MAIRFLSLQINALPEIIHAHVKVGVINCSTIATFSSSSSSGSAAVLLHSFLSLRFVYYPRPTSWKMTQTLKRRLLVAEIASSVIKTIMDLCTSSANVDTLSC